MEQAVKAAIRAGGIKDLPFEQQILVARALLIIKAVPDDVEIYNQEPGRGADC